MRQGMKLFVAAASLAAVAGSGMSLAQPMDDPAEAVAFREANMRIFGGALRASAMLVRNEGGTVEAAQAATAAAAQVAPFILRLFPEGTEQGVGESDALPAIWENWDDFSAGANAASEAIAALAEAAESGDVAAIGAALGAAGQTCGACHETYRAEN
ncbi:MAG: cytochrome c [Azospirillaceae bacterium]